MAASRVGDDEHALGQIITPLRATLRAVAPRDGGAAAHRRAHGTLCDELGPARDVYQPHPVLQGVETMRWLPADRGVHALFVVTGAKWNVARSWLVNANLLMRATDAGLRDAVTPGISIDYTFER
jgi:hypothetical protein